MTLQRYCMQYDGFEECVVEEAYDRGSWVKASDAEAALAKKDEEIRLLKACIFSCLQSDSYEYIKERLEIEESRWEPQQ